jgi:cell division protein FtsN
MATPWQPHNNFHPFEGTIIDRLVPTVSGVYGLHTRRQQLYIGEAADLRETLLLHRKEAAKLFPGRQPSFFSFEVCATNLRASRAQALIAEYRPSIQALQPLSLAAPPPSKSKHQALEVDASGDKTSETTPQWPEAPSTSQPSAIRHSSYFSCSQLVILGLSFVITGVVSGFCGFIAGQKIAEGRQTALQVATARRPVLAYMTKEPSQTEPETKEAAADTGPVEGERLPENAAAPPLKVVSTTAHDGETPLAKAQKNLEVSALNATQADKAEAKPATSPAAKKDLSASTWSVQISATKDQSAAQLLQNKLKNKGFDAFIVEAEINSAQWYRVRVGRFSTNQEAEKARQDLQSKENVANAFVTGK